MTTTVAALVIVILLSTTTPALFHVLRYSGRDLLAGGAFTALIIGMTLTLGLYDGPMRARVAIWLAAVANIVIVLTLINTFPKHSSGR